MYTRSMAKTPTALTFLFLSQCLVAQTAGTNEIQDVTEKIHEW